MPGFNPENINIHDLTIEEPEKGPDSPFDPERDLTGEDWEGMKSSLEDFKNSKSWSNFLIQAEAMKALSPNMDFTDQLTIIDLQHHIISFMNNDVKTVRDYHGLLNSAMRFKVIDPEAYSKISKDISGIIEASVFVKKTMLPEVTIAANDYIQYALNIKMLEPDYDLGFNNRVKQELRDAAGAFRGKDYLQFTLMAMKLRVLGIDFSLTEEDWNGMKAELEDYRNSGGKVKSQYIAMLGMAMKILVANKVEVTDEGLEITMPKKLTESEAPSMPEKRKF